MIWRYKPHWMPISIPQASLLNATRVFVQDSIAERFIKAIQEKTENLVIGDPMQPKTQIGALISDSHLQNVLGHIRKAEKQGAHILTGGNQAFPGKLARRLFYRADHFDRVP